MFTQTVPFGMYGLGQAGGWPQFPVHPQLLQAYQLGYQQDPYAMLARTTWPAAQMANPWVIQALLGELVGAIARQGHVGLGHGAFGPGALGGLPFASPWPTMIGGQFTPQGSYANGLGQQGFLPQAFGVGNVGVGGIGAALPYPTGVGNWSVPTMAMV